MPLPRSRRAPALAAVALGAALLAPGAAQAAYDVAIVDGPTNGGSFSAPPATFVPTAPSATVDADDLLDYLSAGESAAVSTTDVGEGAQFGEIALATPLDAATTTGELRLDAHSGIKLAGDVTLGGPLELLANDQIELSAATLSAERIVFDGSGEVVVQAPATISTSADLTLGTTGPVRVDDDLTLKPTGRLLARSNVEIATGRTLTIAGEGTVSGDIEGSGELRKEGAGLLSLTGTDPFTGTTRIVAGTLRIADQHLDSETVLDGGTLTGDGSVGTVTQAATASTLAPGPGAVTLYTGDLLLGAATTVALDGDLGGAHDQLEAYGSVVLGDATLALTLLSQPALGDTLTLIDQQGDAAVEGAFDGLPEGATFRADGVTLRISYVGGNGNDVTATRVAPPEPFPPDPFPPLPPEPDPPAPTPTAPSDRAPTPHPPSPVPRPAEPTAPRLAVTGPARATASGRQVRLATGVTVRCPRGSAGCTTTVALRGDGRAPGRLLAHGNANVRSSAGHERAVIVPLDARGARLLRAGKSLRVRVVVTTHARSGRTVSLAREATLRLEHRTPRR